MEANTSHWGPVFQEVVHQSWQSVFDSRHQPLIPNSATPSLLLLLLLTPPRPLSRSSLPPNATLLKAHAAPATPPDHSTSSVLVSPSPETSFGAKVNSRPAMRARRGLPVTASATALQNFSLDLPPPSSACRSRSPQSVGTTASHLTGVTHQLPM